MYRTTSMVQMDMNIQNHRQNYVQMVLFVLYVMNHKCAHQAQQASIQIAKDQHRLQNVHQVSVSMNAYQA